MEKITEIATLSIDEIHNVSGGGWPGTEPTGWWDKFPGWLEPWDPDDGIPG